MSEDTPYIKTIELPDGSTLTLEYNDRFIGKVRKHFELSPDEEVTDRLLRDFFAASLAGV